MNYNAITTESMLIEIFDELEFSIENGIGMISRGRTRQYCTELLKGERLTVQQVMVLADAYHAGYINCFENMDEFHAKLGDKTGNKHLEELVTGGIKNKPLLTIQQ
jgi:hypothetical protein